MAWRERYLGVNCGWRVKVLSETLLVGAVALVLAIGLAVFTFGWG